MSELIDYFMFFSSFKAMELLREMVEIGRRRRQLPSPMIKVCLIYSLITVLFRGIYSPEIVRHIRGYQRLLGIVNINALPCDAPNAKLLRNLPAES